MEKLHGILQKIREGKILSKATFQNVDVESVLEQRDCIEFENEWLRVFNEIEKLSMAHPLKPDELNLVNVIREMSYKTVYKHTEYPEICGYVSDDFDMISKAILLSYHDDWLSALINSYDRGIFPSGSLIHKL